MFKCTKRYYSCVSSPLPETVPPAHPASCLYLVNAVVFLLFLFLKEQNPFEALSGVRTWHLATETERGPNTIRGKDFGGCGGSCLFLQYILHGPTSSLQQELKTNSPSVIPVGLPALRWLPEMTPSAERYVWPSPAVAGRGRQHVAHPTRPAGEWLTSGPRLAPTPGLRTLSTATAQVCWGGASGHPAPSHLRDQWTTSAPGPGKSSEAGMLSRGDGPAPGPSRPARPASPSRPLSSCGVTRGFTGAGGEGSEWDVGPAAARPPTWARWGQRGVARGVARPSRRAGARAWRRGGVRGGVRGEVDGRVRAAGPARTAGRGRRARVARSPQPLLAAGRPLACLGSSRVGCEEGI